MSFEHICNAEFDTEGNRVVTISNENISKTEMKCTSCILGFSILWLKSV